MRALLTVAFWAAVWQTVAAVVDVPLLLPGPIQVAGALGRLIQEQSFWSLVGLTLGRVLLGFALGALVGFLLAVGTFFVPVLDILLSPAVRVIRAAPVSSFILLCMLWLRSGIVPGFIAALMTMPIVWQNVENGLQNTDEKLLEVSRVFRMSRFRSFCCVYIPSVWGYFRAACVTSMGMAFKSGVAAEVLCQPKRAIGTQLYYAKIYLETENLFAWTAVVVGFSIILERLLILLLNRAKK